MQVDLSEELQRFVEAKVQSGAFTSPDQVVENALARWRAEEEIDPTELTRLVAEGQAEADRGEFEDAEAVFDRIRQQSQHQRTQGK